MANPTRRIYVTDAEATALERIVVSAEFQTVPRPEDVKTVQHIIDKLLLAGQAQPNRT